MNKIFTFFFITISSIFSNPDKSCIDNIFLLNKKIIDNKIFLISAEINSINNNQIKIYIEKNKKIRIDYNQSIIISDKKKTINYNKNTNRLIIEKSDSLFNEIFFSIDNDKSFYNNFKKYTNLNNLKIYVDTLCSSIDSMKYQNHETIFILNSFNFMISDLESLDLDIDKEKTFIYDFR